MKNIYGPLSIIDHRKSLLEQNRKVCSKLKKQVTVMESRYLHNKTTDKIFGYYTPDEKSLGWLLTSSISAFFYRNWCGIMKRAKSISTVECFLVVGWVLIPRPVTSLYFKSLRCQKIVQVSVWFLVNMLPQVSLVSERMGDYQQYVAIIIYPRRLWEEKCSRSR